MGEVDGRGGDLEVGVVDAPEDAVTDQGEGIGTGEAALEVEDVAAVAFLLAFLGGVEPGLEVGLELSAISRGAAGIGQDSAGEAAESERGLEREVDGLAESLLEGA